MRRLAKWGLGLFALGLLVLGAGLFFGLVDLLGARWPVKTFRDADRGLVRLGSVTDSTVAELTRIPRPPAETISGRHRVPPQELTVYRVRARLRGVVGSGDGDLHLLLADLSDPSSRMITEVPHPLLAIGSGMGDTFRGIRESVRGRRLAGRIVIVTGVGFFDRPGRGKSPNGFELHPVLSVEIVP
jgi:hypothetical protein